MSELNKSEVSADKVSENKDADFSDVFVTENDTFDVVVRYYKEGSNVFVENVDDNFDKTKKIKEFTVTFKYPNQSDVAQISSSFPKIGAAGEIDARDFMRMEFTRLLCLIRKWSLKKPLENSSVLSVHPKIIKGMVSQIREKIGTDGII